MPRYLKIGAAQMGPTTGTCSQPVTEKEPNR
jgi:hypothetical protein